MENKLIPMTDYCLYLLNQHAPYDEVEMLTKISNYGNFLKQYLTIGSFVPCNENGDVLEEPSPENFNWGYLEDKNTFNKAKEKVLFVGFEYLGIWSGFWQLKHTSGQNFLIRRSGIETVESLLTRGIEIELTESTLKNLKWKN